MSISALLRRPWLWAWLGALAVWLATAAYTGGRGSTEVLSTALTFGAFFVIVALGQMFVITLGPGNVDLSIPACMTLAGTVAMKTMGGSAAMLAPGLLLALLIGLFVGTANYTLIRLLRLPPIIATLSSSFIFQSMAIWWNRGLRVKPPELLAEFTTTKIAGVPLLAILVILLAIAGHILLTRTVFGRSVIAIGQNPRAAHLAGIGVERVKAATYLMCATLAGLCGYLLAGFSGGAALNMGEEYLLSSIAVVVIGGTSVAGGFANVPGLWGAALFLFLLVTMLNTIGAGAGIRMVMTGLIIIGVIVAASGGKTRE
ncbi:MAG: ABC transporter permease [Geminicoccaceae bacterium]